MYSISLSMIVKNEEKFLDQCLSSAKDAVDEIVIIDTGSTDRTLSIAKKYNARIFHYKWNDDFSAARNFALKNSSCDWILYLDADEMLSDDSLNLINRLKKEVPDKAFECIITNIDRQKGRPSTMLYPRVFPNKPEIKFEGKIHEQIENSLIINKIPVVKSKVEIIHHGYDLDKKGTEQKAERNLKILNEEYKSNPSSYCAYQLGQTYGILNKSEDAVKYFLIAINDPELKPEYKSVAYRFIALVYAEKNNYDQALEFINKSFEYDDSQPLALLAAASINIKLNNKNETVRLCKKAYESNKSYLNNKRTSSQAIMLDEKSIFYEIVNLVNSLNDRKILDYFLNYFAEKLDAEFQAELNALKRLINNEPFPEVLLDNWIKRIDEKNAGIISSFLLSYRYQDELLKLFLQKFYNKVDILKEVALVFKDETGSIVEEILQQAFDLDNTYGSLVFYLISLKLRNNKLTEIPPIIHKAEIKFKDQPEILNRIHEMKRKVTPLCVPI